MCNFFHVQASTISAAVPCFTPVWRLQGKPSERMFKKKKKKKTRSDWLLWTAHDLAQHKKTVERSEVSKVWRSKQWIQVRPSVYICNCLNLYFSSAPFISVTVFGRGKKRVLVPVKDVKHNWHPAQMAASRLEMSEVGFLTRLYAKSFVFHLCFSSVHHSPPPPPPPVSGKLWTPVEEEKDTK